jgi:hypothetical protein
MLAQVRSQKRAALAAALSWPDITVKGYEYA